MLHGYGPGEAHLIGWRTWLDMTWRNKLLCFTSLTPEHPFPFFQFLWAASSLENQALSTVSERFFTNSFHWRYKTEMFKGWKHWRRLLHHTYTFPSECSRTWLASSGFTLRFKDISVGLNHFRSVTAEQAAGKSKQGWGVTFCGEDCLLELFIYACFQGIFMVLN